MNPKLDTKHRDLGRRRRDLETALSNDAVRGRTSRTAPFDKSSEIVDDWRFCRILSILSQIYEQLKICDQQFLKVSKTFLFNPIIRDHLPPSWKAPASRHGLQPRLSLDPMVYMELYSNGIMSPHPIYCGCTQSCRKCPKVTPGWLCTSCIYTHLQQLQWWHTSMLQRKSRPNAVCGGTNQTGCHGHLWHNSRANGTARAHINKSHHAWHGTLTQEKKGVDRRAWWSEHGEIVTQGTCMSQRQQLWTCV